MPFSSWVMTCPRADSLPKSFLARDCGIATVLKSARASASPSAKLAPNTLNSSGYTMFTLLSNGSPILPFDFSTLKMILPMKGQVMLPASM